eukprot:5009502-Alexandrium_andersonii.AAC.1
MPVREAKRNHPLRVDKAAPGRVGRGPPTGDVSEQSPRRQLGQTNRQTPTRSFEPRSSNHHARNSNGTPQRPCEPDCRAELSHHANWLTQSTT